MDTKKLRQKVLDLAIHGKLVNQDPNDEPASILLDRIRAEKARLVKEGKIKKSDLIEKPISEEEIPFEVPEGWEWCKLSKISLDSADGPFGSNLKKEHYTNRKEVRIIQLSNIGESGWKDSNVKYTTFDYLPNIARSEAFAGDIIIAKMMPAGRAIICPNEDKKYVLSSDAVRFNFPSYLDNKYLYYAINSAVFKTQVYGEVQGVTRVRTSLNKLRTYFIPLPPLAEQRRIVKAVDELFEQIDIIERSEKELEEAANKTRDKLLNLAIQGHLVPQDPNEEPASVLLERIRAEKARLVKEGKLKKKDLEEKPISPDEIPFDIPEGWVWTCMKECNYFMSSQEDPTKKPEKQYELYSVPTFETGMPEFVKGKEISSSKVIVQKNDVLLCKINPHLNRSWVVSHYNEELPCIASSEWIVFRNHYISPKYLRYCFISPYFKNLMMSNVSGVGGSLMRAQPVSVAKYLFPLPPLSEQRRIVTKLEELLQEIDKLKA